jgi:hypothetical protein
MQSLERFGPRDGFFKKKTMIYMYFVRTSLCATQENISLSSYMCVNLKVLRFP